MSCPLLRLEQNQRYTNCVGGLPGKPNGINGAEVGQYYRDGRIREIADCCESDVVNTYRVWLRHELFQGKLTELGFQASETNLDEFCFEMSRRTAMALVAIQRAFQTNPSSSSRR